MPDALHDVCSGVSSDQLSTQPWSHIGDSLSGVNETETESGFSKNMDKQICGND